jgi:hypothetical protein
MQLSVAVIGKMIDMARSRGQSPAEIHMCRETLDAMQVGAPPPRDTRTPLQRMCGSLPPPRALFGLPVVENPQCAVGVIALRDRSALDNAHWMEAVLTAQHDHVPWLERGPAPPSSADDPVSLAALAASPHRASPGDVLIKAFEGIDHTRDLIVIRCMQNGSLEMSGTLNKMEMMGALQIAMAYVMHGS